MHSLRRVSVPA